MPHPLAQLAQYSSAAPIYRPMCGHPDARRSVIDGSLLTTCVEARGVDGATHLPICCQEAKLFEQAPPPLEPAEMLTGLLADMAQCDMPRKESWSDRLGAWVLSKI
jgi:hypothetical protein